jgi:hypothetical protein
MVDRPLPELRASDADREQVVERLRRAAGDGQLSVSELDDRLDATYSARTRSELDRLIADLQPDPASPPAPGRSSGGLAVRPGPGGTRWLLAILGGSDRKGRWRLAQRCTALNIMGGSDIDLTDAELAADRVELEVISVMGGADIYVPEGLNVEVSEFALLGGNSVDENVGGAATPGAPTLHLRMYSIMGGSDVKRGPKLSRAERRALKKRWRKQLRG